MSYASQTQVSPDIILAADANHMITTYTEGLSSCLEHPGHNTQGRGINHRHMQVHLLGQFSCVGDR